MPRNASTAARAKAIDAVLIGLFRALEARPTPEAFRLFLAQLCDPATLIAYPVRSGDRA
jgi:hypothetical protein